MKNKIKIGNYQMQSTGYKAFIPLSFPPIKKFPISSQTENKHVEAIRLLGKLDGIAQLLPDKDFFLMMFVKKEAASSSQIEGTQATMVNAIEVEISSHAELPRDVEDIVHYIRALNYGLKRIESIPLSVRFLCEIHKELMQDARRASYNPFPGEIRYSQNWIRGTSPSNALFVPPPPHEVPRALGDLEKFIHSNDSFPSLIKAALLHAQFETIHPFVDGNGRTGRLLITFYLWHAKLIESPLLYLSVFFKKHQKLYYELLQDYHSEEAKIEDWIDFFLEGIIETAKSAIDIAYKINFIREEDMLKIHKFGKMTAGNSVEILRKLYAQPIIDVSKIQEWTGFSRVGAKKVIERFIDIGILHERLPVKMYGKTYEYKAYLDLFRNG